jgi:hypothetical protein
MIASNQSDELQLLINFVANQDGKDKWALCNSKVPFSCKKVYLAMSPNEKAPAPFNWIWKSCVQPKHKFFFWILIQDRLNTRDLLHKKTMQIPSTGCALCDDSINECYMHMFFSCDISQIFW